MISSLFLSLIILQSVLAKLAVEDIKTVHETFVGEKQDVVINPRGPLNLLRGYIGNRNGYMYNKRFFSSEIDTDYALTKTEVSSIGEQEYNFKRKPVNDRVHKDMDTKTPEGKYLSMYHTLLIKMFPSADGDLSIEAGRSNALTNFLREDHVKKDTKYILAALLLLSEGVDIKIIIDHTGEKKKLVIKSKKSKEKVFVDVEMHTAGLDPVTNEHSENIYQSEAAEIVKFYIRCRDNPLLKKGGVFAMPATKEQFESGNFLNSAAFLIQTYIYEFIDTAESYKDFVNAAHELLIDQVAEKENSEQTKKKGKKGRIFDELFIAKDAFDENKKYIESFCDLLKATNENAKFPFCNDSQLPRYTRVPRRKLKKSGFELNQSLYYSNCVETALLGLFCCLAYNPETGKYETDHMGKKISKELKNFFGDYPKPTEITDFEMHKRWCEVVACLKNKKIDYRQSKNELLSGVRNIFLAISEITGKKKEILKLVKCIKAVCKAGKLDDKQKEDMSNKIESIIKSLSLNKSVRVECNDMALGKRSSGKADILAEINIIYTFGEVSNGVSLDIKQGHAELSLISSSNTSSAYIKEKYEEVKNIYSRINCYIGYIADQYISAELDALICSDYNRSKELKEILTPIIQKALEGISRIFLLGRISDIDVKRIIMNIFIIRIIDKELGPTNPLTRFTANLLGSVPLNDYASRWRTMIALPFHASWQELYPRLGFKPSENIPKRDPIWYSVSMLDLSSVLLALPARTALKSIYNYLESTMNNNIISWFRLYMMRSKDLFYHIMSNGAVDDLVKIQSTFKEEPVKECDLNTMYISWVFYACSDVSKFTEEFIKTAYDFITVDNLPDICNFKLIGRCNVDALKKFLSVFEEKKALFCSEDNSESMIKYDKLVSFFKLAIEDKGLYLDLSYAERARGRYNFE
ncbi:hypothetical protein NEAUS04_1512 [Nematocida ausubeli]|nr:hypothetical protein NEAUS04_1512 [Nematocida ausubeli]